MKLNNSESSSKTVTIGLFGIGLDTYWPQFKGLKERLEGYLTDISNIIQESSNIKLIDVGLIDNPERAETVGSLFRKEQVDLIFLYISTYALSSTVLPVIRNSEIPLVILNIQPVAAIDYKVFNKMKDRGDMTGEWLAHCQACSVPEIANVLNRAGRKYHLITGYLRDSKIKSDIHAGSALLGLPWLCGQTVSVCWALLRRDA